LRMPLEESDAAVATARVVSQHRDRYVVRLSARDIDARLPGRFRHTAAFADAFPAVGDWVTVTLTEGDPPIATIRSVLPRRSAFRRKAAGDVTTAQIVAANIDVALIAAALPGDVNPRRIERYLALAW